MYPLWDITKKIYLVLIEETFNIISKSRGGKTKQTDKCSGNRSRTILCIIKDYSHSRVYLNSSFPPATRWRRCLPTRWNLPFLKTSCSTRCPVEVETDSACLLRGWQVEQGWRSGQGPRTRIRSRNRSRSRSRGRKRSESRKRSGEGWWVRGTQGVSSSAWGLANWDPLSVTSSAEPAAGHDLLARLILQNSTQNNLRY